MNIRKPCPYTDDDILTMPKITAQIAAKYLGWTYERLCWMMREDAEKGTRRITFGTATKRRQWTYYIDGEALVKFKYGADPVNEGMRKSEAMKLFVQLDENKQSRVLGYMERLNEESHNQSA